VPWILGIDFGDKKVGLAITNEKVKIVHPLKTVKKKELQKEVKRICEEYEVKKIVIGIPLNKEGRDTTYSKKIKTEIKNFIPYNLLSMIEFWDESFTSFEAESIMKEEGMPLTPQIVDKISAKIMLEDYLSNK
jgi:putative Holliday junction resolvase